MFSFHVCFQMSSLWKCHTANITGMWSFLFMHSSNMFFQASTSKKGLITDGTLVSSFFPSWIIFIWVFKPDGVLSIFWQIRQGNVVPSWTVLTCCSNWLFIAYFLPHVEQIWPPLFSWSNEICLCKVALFA